MPSSKTSDVVIELTQSAQVADTTADPQTDPMSYYKRNSGLLPRLTDTVPGTYDRGALPKPIDPGPDSLMDRLRHLVAANRDARRTQQSA